MMFRDIKVDPIKTYRMNTNMNLEIARISKSFFTISARRKRHELFDGIYSLDLPRIGFVIGMSSNMYLNIGDNFLAETTLIFL